MIAGVAGCGQMGLPMAQALEAAGIATRGFDIRPPSDFGDFGPSMSPGPAQFADGLEVLVSVVRDIPQTEDLLFGTQGLTTHARDLRLIMICSTVSPRYVTALRDRIDPAVALIDAPMSGAPVAARERRLSFMIGGDAESVEQATPLLRAMGSSLHHLGPLGAGMTAKVLNNLVAASSVAATRVAMDWAGDLGIDRDALLAVLNTSSGQTWYSSNFDRIVFAREGFDPSNTMGILKKDLESALDGAPAGADPALPRALIAAISRLKTVP